MVGTNILWVKIGDEVVPEMVPNNGFYGWERERVISSGGREFHSLGILLK